MHPSAFGLIKHTLTPLHLPLQSPRHHCPLRLAHLAQPQLQIEEYALAPHPRRLLLSANLSLTPRILARNVSFCPPQQRPSIPRALLGRDLIDGLLPYCFRLRELRDRGIEIADQGFGAGIDGFALRIGEVGSVGRANVRVFGGGSMAVAAGGADGRGSGGEIRGADGAEIGC